MLAGSNITHPAHFMSTPLFRGELNAKLQMCLVLSPSGLQNNYLFINTRYNVNLSPSQGGTSLVLGYHV